MKVQLIAAALLVLLPAAHFAYAQDVPDWVRNNAGWWAEGTISEGEFISAIEFLTSEGIIQIPDTPVTEQSSDGIPDWVKNTALWWSQGLITDGEFVGGIQYLAASGIIVVGMTDAPTQTAADSMGGDTMLSQLQVELEACSGIVRAYERISCQEAAEEAIIAHVYMSNGEAFEAGPMTFYYNGHEFEVTPAGQAVLRLSMLAENRGSDNVAMMCTGPAVCNYDVWNGEKAFKYSGTDFTSGQIVIKPGLSSEFNMVFGPNIGYGGTTFEYDPSRDYVFRIQEPWGGVEIPLELG